MADVNDGNGGHIQIINQLLNISQQIGQLTKAYKGRFSSGAFTLSAATTTVVSNGNVNGNSAIQLQPTNGTAALLQRSQGVFVSVQTAAVGFVVSTQTGVASGTENFSYIVFTPG